MPTQRILVADDDEFVSLSLKLLLEQAGLEVTTTPSPERIPSILAKEAIDLVLLDMNFRQGDTTSTQGLFWLKQIRELNPDVPIIVITAYGEIPLAVEAMRQGAYDFVTKPWGNEKLLIVVKNALALSQEKSKARKSPRKNDRSSFSDELIGDSEKIRAIRKLIDKVSVTDTAVLILGDNGTGKEVIAKSIHQRSMRSSGVFVSVDVGSLSESIFESELFGHRKGAFTDAKEDRVGRIESANGGTLFLDEIGNLPLSLQAKLLTVLQNKTVVRLGTNTPIPVDIRVVSATNSNLKQLVKEGRFREDLYYRINTVEITVPPLLDRPEDLPMLAEHFLSKFKTRYEKTDRQIPDDVMATLQKYRWPGNVRELQHAMERAIILSEKPMLTLEDFGVTRNENSGDLIFDQLNLDKLEKWAIKKAMDKHKGNVSHAAQELGLSRGAMYRRMEKYGL
jgi:two-component system, NtrC family, response regulator HydG